MLGIDDQEQIGFEDRLNYAKQVPIRRNPQSAGADNDSQKIQDELGTFIKDQFGKLNEMRGNQKKANLSQYSLEDSDIFKDLADF